MKRYQSANLQQGQIGSGSGAQAALGESARGFQSLSSKLSDFSTIAMGQHQAVKTTEAARNATIDVNRRKKKIQEIEARGGSQEEINNVLEGQMKKDDTIYGRAYNTNFGAAYANQVTIDAKSSVEMAMVEAKKTRDPGKAFIESYPKYSQKVVRHAPTEELAIIAQQQFDQYGSTAYKALEMERIKQGNVQLKDSFDNTLKLLEEQFMSGDKTQKGKAYTQYLKASEDGIKNGWTNEGSVKYNLNRINKASYTEDRFKAFKVSKDPIAFLDSFRENTTLTTQETEDALGKMHSMLKSKTDDYKLVEAEDTKEEEATKRNVGIQLNTQLIEGTLTQEDLDNALKLNMIDRPTYDDLLQRSKSEGVSEGDEDAYQQYLMEIDNFSLENIYNDRTLSNTQKTTLIKTKMDTDSKHFREATKQSSIELKNSFGILEGTIMAKTDFNNKLARDYARLQSELYDFIQDIDPELIGRQRGAYALEFIRKRIDEYNKGEIVGTSKYLEPKEEKEPQEETIKGANNMTNMINQVEER